MPLRLVYSKKGDCTIKDMFRVLELQSDDPNAAGMAHGYLLGASLNDMLATVAFGDEHGDKNWGNILCQAQIKCPRNCRSHSG